jgi:hypothetical protein
MTSRDKLEWLSMDADEQLRRMRLHGWTPGEDAHARQHAGDVASAANRDLHQLRFSLVALSTAPSAT